MSRFNEGNKTVPGKKPNKKELARMKALSDMGESNRSIARRMEKSHATVKKYLNSAVFTDPSIGKMIDLAFILSIRTAQSDDMAGYG